MNLHAWEAAHLLTTLELSKQFPGVIFKSPQHLVNIWGSPRIGAGTEIGAFVEIGDEVGIGRNCRIGAYVFLCPGVCIDDDVFIAPRVTFSNDRHPQRPSRWPLFPDWSRTLVKTGAVIGAGAVILPGVTIGDGATVGAGSVVTKSVPPGETWLGNPARPLRRAAWSATKAASLP